MEATSQDRERHGGVKMGGRSGCCTESSVAKTEVSNDKCLWIPLEMRPG